MKLTAYLFDGADIEIRPAPVQRDWMDRSDDRFAYRCLPLVVANTSGWEILTREAFSATWNGGEAKAGITIEGGGGHVVSHFGCGVLTFHVPVLFRSEPGVDLQVTGPINRPKHGCSPLTGIVETDWAPFTFTMNWRFTAPGTVRFEAGEPFCHVMPLKRDAVASCEPELRLLSDDLELSREVSDWVRSRELFLKDLGEAGTDAHRVRWQKHYLAGVERSRVRAKPFHVSTFHGL